MNIASIVGTRPNFIKCAAISKEIRKEHEETLIHTGQHYDYELSKIFFEGLHIPEPDFHLAVGSGSHGQQTGEMLKKLEEVLLNIKPNVVLVYGDCNCTLAGAIAAAKLHMKVGHIEAGLRSFDRSMPEEINRVLVDHCSDFLFCPTKTAVSNLKKEGVEKGVFLTGDVMVDTLNYYRELAKKSDILNRLGVERKKYILATIHRPSNTDKKNCLKNIVDVFCEIDDQIIFPVHPRTEKALKENGMFDRLEKHVRVIKPLGYLDFLGLMSNSKKVLTDSGGIQKEVYILNVPCVTLRDSTEWIETVEDGWNVLVGSNKKKILDAASNFNPNNKPSNVFAIGASKNILHTIMENID